MNTCPTLVIIVGFAYALQRVENFFSFKTAGINNAYLFSYNCKFRNHYLSNLMSLAYDTASPQESFLLHSTREYIKNPIVRQEEFFRDCPEYFSLKKTFGDGNEDVFDYSILSQQGKSLGKDICRDYLPFFGKLVRSVCRRQESGNTNTSFGIIFTSRE